MNIEKIRFINGYHPKEGGNFREYDKLDEHIFIENKWRLLESNGHITDIDEYIDVVEGNIMPYFDRLPIGQVMPFEFGIDDFRLIENKFFDKIYLLVNVMRSSFTRYSGGYIVNETKLSDNGHFKQNGKVYKRADMIVIKVNVSANTLDGLFGLIDANIGHELLHALDHVCRLNNNNNYYNDDDRIGEYKKTVALTLSSDEIKSKFGQLLYHLTNPEKNAFVGMAYGEMLNHIDNISELTHKEQRELIKGTTAWLKFKENEEFLRLLHNQPTEKQSELLSIYNLIANNHEWCKFNTYDNLLKEIDHRMGLYKNIIEKKLPSMLAELMYNARMIEKGNVAMMGNGVKNIYKRRKNNSKIIKK